MNEWPKIVLSRGIVNRAVLLSGIDSRTLGIQKLYILDHDIHLSMLSAQRMD